MKKIILISVFCVLCSLAYAANEIQSFTNCSAAFAVVRELDGDVWYVSGQVFEAWGTTGRTALDYDIALTAETGGMFTGTFDTNISAGYYHIITHDDADSTPADADPATWVEYGYWDGDEWFKGALSQDVNDLTLDVADVNTAVWTSLVADFTGELTFGGEVGGLDPNLTLVLADSNEIQTDQEDGGRLDVIWDAIKYKTDLITILDTTVADGNDSNNFTISDGRDVNDAHWFASIQVEDADTGLREIRWIEFYDENSGDPNIWVDEPFSFTPASGDKVYIMGTTYGGYLYDIKKAANQSRGVINRINDTRRTRTTGIRSIDIMNEDEFGMPGWP